MTYARVIDGVITELKGKPNWYFDNGTEVSDAWLLENEDLRVLLNGTLPTYDNQTQNITENDWSQWTIEATQVTKTYTVNDIPFEDIKSRFLSKPKQYRRIHEEGGIQFTDSSTNVLNIQTDIPSQSKIMASYQAVKDGLRVEDSLWKTSDGFVAISNADMTSLATSLLSYIQACFDNENTLMNLVDSATTVSELNAIDFESGWPNNAV